jgi:uncharacterized damage-inducible protein DinB
MKTHNSLLIAVSLIAVLALSISFSKKPADNCSRIDTMVADWQRAKAYTQEYLDAATPEMITFLPPNNVRTFAQQMLHFTELNYWLASEASGRKSPITEPRQLVNTADQYKTKEALTKAVMDGYDFVIESLKGMDPSQMSETITITFVNQNHVITKESCFNRAFEHQTHHRGQATIYFRLNGIVPPQQKLF